MSLTRSLTQPSKPRLRRHRKGDRKAWTALLLSSFDLRRLQELHLPTKY